MAGDTFDQPPMDAVAFTDWLVEQLGRPLLIVALRRAGEGAASEAAADPLAGWRVGLAAYPAVRLRVEVISEAPDAATLVRIAQFDPDALVVCEDAHDASGAPTPGDWRAAILDAAEGLNLFERMLLAWYGAGVTRAAARAAGYEDGFAPDQPLADALAILAQEAINRETYRRRGSSPPCYL